MSAFIQGMCPTAVGQSPFVGRNEPPRAPSIPGPQTAVRLLDALVAGGARLHYSGDFGGKGLMIARALAARYGTSFVPWRFDARTHLVALGSRGESGCSGVQAASMALAEFDALAGQIRRLARGDVRSRSLSANFP